MSTSILNYATFKYVVIRDKRLGIAYYAMNLAVVLYACSEIIVNKGYLEYDEFPIGSLRLLPKDEKSNVSDVAREPYCCQARTPDAQGNGINKLLRCEQCQRLDAKVLSWPVESQTLTIATFIKDKWQSLHSPEHHGSNADLEEDGFVTEKKESYFPLDPESIMLKVEHSFVASRFTNLGTGREELASSNRKMDGFLYGINGTRLRMISTEGQSDKISLSELLHAAGLETGLDTVSDAANANGNSYRNRGCVLRVSIVYENDRGVPFGTGHPVYRYHVRRVPYTDFRIHQLIPIYSQSVDGGAAGAGHAFRPGARLIRKRYGVHISFDQTGKLGVFSLSSLLRKLFTSICMITIIPSVLDTLILYIIPGRGQYRSVVYEETADGDGKAADGTADTEPTEERAPPSDTTVTEVQSIASASAMLHAAGQSREPPGENGDQSTSSAATVVVPAATATDTESTVHSRQTESRTDGQQHEQ